MAMADISFIITSYNYARYIERAIASCLEQEASKYEFEVIIVDDGSTDDTRAILSKIQNIKIKIIHISNSGLERAANIGIANATGRYIVRLDADDELCQDYLVKLDGLLEQEYDIIYGNYSIIDHLGTVVSSPTLPTFDKAEIMQRGDFLATGTVVKRELFQTLSMYNEAIANSGLENYEMILTALQNNRKFKHISEILFKYRLHGGNMSTTKREKIIQHGDVLFARMGMGKFGFGEFHPYAGKANKPA